MKKLLVALLMVPAVAHAGFLDGNELFKRMTSSDVTDRIHALGYVVGVYDAYESDNHCAPSGVTAGQVRDVVKLYFDRNPEVRNYQADILIRDALRRVWPCAKKKGA